MTQPRSKNSFGGTFIYVLLIVALYFVGQTVIVVLHEHAHSSAAWLLGYSSTPFTVVWGNPITMRGWDEGVPYDQLFPHRGNPAESVIGGIPLFMHTVFVTLGLLFLLRKRPTRSRLAFLTIYWFLIANLAELIAYLWMRPFIPTGDTGRFNAGLSLTPWPLFLIGNALLTVAFALVVRGVMPLLDQVVGESGSKHWINVVFTGFLCFSGPADSASCRSIQTRSGSGDSAASSALPFGSSWHVCAATRAPHKL